MNVSGLEKVGILRKVKLKKTVNSHSSCEIEMILEGTDYINLKKYVGSEIIVENDERKLMRGKISSFRLKHAFSVSTVVFFADSLSVNADRKKLNRVFQDTKKKNSDIIALLKNERCTFQIIDKGFSCEIQDSVVIQNNETDFQFAKGMTLSKGLYLFVDDISQNCSINIGSVYSSRVASITDEDMITFDYELTQDTEKIVISSRKFFEFGSKVSLNGYEYLIAGFTLLFENGIETYQYVFLRNTGELCADKLNESVILGRGKVISNEDPAHLGRIQVAFLEYEDPQSDNRVWIPYVNNLTEQDCGVMFLPDKDEIVSLYYCNSQCYASGCVREKAFNSQMNEVSVRSIFTRNVKVDISDKKVELSAFDFRIMIDNENALIQKDKVKVSVNSNEILIKNDKSSVVADDTAIKIVSDSRLQLKAKEVNTEGSSKVTIKTSALDIS